MLPSSIWQFLHRIVIYLIFSALLSFFLFHYCVSAYQISGNSMEPFIAGGERVLIHKFRVSSKKISRGDLVVALKPGDGSLIIKRIIGLPGEKLDFVQGKIRINQHLLPLASFQASALRSLPMKPFSMTIPSGHYFLLGDNLSRSIDSRHFGTVSGDYIIGKVMFRYWPFSRFGSIEPSFKMSK